MQKSSQYNLLFTFKPVKKNQINNLVKSSNDEKAIQSADTPTKLIKELCDFFFEFIYKRINHCIIECNFTVDLKRPEVRPLC